MQAAVDILRDITQINGPIHALWKVKCFVKLESDILKIMKLHKRLKKWLNITYQFRPLSIELSVSRQ